MNITGSTRLAGVLGYPVRYSLSPAMHNAAYRELGIDAVYVALPVETGVEVAVRTIRTFDMLGVSVTIPHKEAVIPFLTDLTPAARKLGAVNCIDSNLHGYNTDGQGFVASLREAGFDPSGKRAVLFGAGGSARAVAVALAAAKVSDLAIVNRSEARAQAAVQQAGAPSRVGAEHDVREADLIVNATPLGMNGTNDGEVAFDIALISKRHVVADLVYHPLNTPLLLAASAKGATVVYGTGMLLHQAAEQIRIWTGLDAPIDVMRKAAQL